MFLEVTARTWDEAKDIGRALSTTCVFRGHSDSRWPLATTIERAAAQFSCSPNLIWIREKMMARDFRARAHTYLSSVPAAGEDLEWLSLLQHYGGPTRLLDFTESFYVACHFAVDAAAGDACVWAVDDLRLRLLAERTLGLEDAEFPTRIEKGEAIIRFAESFLIDRNKSSDFVVRVRPIRLNERAAVQKGVFLFPCNVSRPFEANLCAAFRMSSSALESGKENLASPEEITQAAPLGAAVIKINLPRGIHCDAYLDLYSMNLDSASLFPGLGGFARSLKYHLRVMEKRAEVSFLADIFAGQQEAGADAEDRAAQP